MILPASAENRVFLKQADSGNCFSRVKNSCPGASDSLNKLRRKRGQPREVLDEVDGFSFRGKKGSRAPFHGEHQIPWADRRSVLLMDSNYTGRIHSAERHSRKRNAADDAHGLGNDARPKPLLLAEKKVAGQIPAILR